MDPFTTIAVVGGVVAVVVAGVWRINSDRREKAHKQSAESPTASDAAPRSAEPQVVVPQVVVKSNNGVVVVLLIILILLIAAGMFACATAEITLTPA